METEGPWHIGPFQILEEIGRGGMGIVYRAFDPTIGRHLAVKVLHMSHLASEIEMAEARARFSREATAAGRLSHPGIVTLYQLGQEGEFQYLAMELVAGRSLEGLMPAGQPWRETEMLGVIRQIAEALDYAHANGIVHRDIKPANVLVQSDGRVKVTDFGIARIASQTMTRTGTTMGTPAYMAPEQVEGKKADARVDQFSLAVVAYQLLAGKLPFDGLTDFALAYQIVNAEPVSLVSANPRLALGVDAVIRRALAKNPEARFATCVEFATALERAVAALSRPPRAETLVEALPPRPRLVRTALPPRGSPKSSRLPVRRVLDLWL